MNTKSMGLVFVLLNLAACQYTLVPGGGNLSGGLSFLDQKPTLQTEKLGIVGGELVLPEDPLRRSVVGVYENTEGQVCTGTLITKNTVLTAAHCIGPQMAIVFDDHFNENSDLRVVVKKNVYPAYLAGKDSLEDTYDLALLEFAGDLPSQYQPAKMITFEIWNQVQKKWEQEKKNQSIIQILLAGFGFDRPETREGIGQLRKVQATVEDFHYGMFSVLINQEVSGGICEGDSGGPAFINFEGEYYLWAVSSHALSADEKVCRFKSVFTQVLPFSEWLISLQEKQQRRKDF